MGLLRRKKTAHLSHVIDLREPGAAPAVRPTWGSPVPCP